MATTFQLLALWVWAFVVNAAAAVEQTCPAGGCAEAKQDGDDETEALRVSLLQYKSGSTMTEDSDRPDYNSGKQCTSYPNPNGYNEENKCTGGNQAYLYTYNRNRYSWNSACGTQDCWCCTQSGGSNPPRRRRGGYNPPRRRRGGYNPPRRRRGGWNPPRRRRGGGGGRYQLFSGYQCQNGYQPISNPQTCESAAAEVQNKRLTVDTNVPSSSDNPHGCYIYGSPGRYTNLYYNYQGKSQGTWEKRNVICERRYSSLTQTTGEELDLESKKTQLLEELQAIDAELAEIGDVE